MGQGKNRITVLTMVNSLNVGGVEKTLLACIKYFSTDHIKIIICVFRPGGKLEPEFKKLGIEIVAIRKTGLIVIDFLQLLILFATKKIDVVHSRMGYTSGGFVMAAKIAKKKSIVSFHSTFPSALKKFKKQKLIYFFLLLHLKIHKWITKNFSDHIVGHSRANLSANFENWEQNRKYQIIYNGIDFKNLCINVSNNEFLKEFKKPGDFLLIHVGSMRPEKNHFFMIDCLKRLHEYSNHFKLLLLGEGGLLDEVKAYALKLELNQYVYFAGHDSNIKPYFNLADLFFFPSVNEGLGNVLIEAQYFEVPICASGIPPHYESVFEDYHSFFFNPQSIDEAVGSLKNMEQLIKKGAFEDVKQTAKEFVITNFAIETMATKLAELYTTKH